MNFDVKNDRFNVDILRNRSNFPEIRSNFEESAGFSRDSDCIMMQEAFDGEQMSQNGAEMPLVDAEGSRNGAEASQSGVDVSHNDAAEISHNGARVSQVGADDDKALAEAYVANYFGTFTVRGAELGMSAPKRKSIDHRPTLPPPPIKIPKIQIKPTRVDQSGWFREENFKTICTFVVKMLQNAESVEDKWHLNPKRSLIWNLAKEQGIVLKPNGKHMSASRLQFAYETQILPNLEKYVKNAEDLHLLRSKIRRTSDTIKVSEKCPDSPPALNVLSPPNATKATSVPVLMNYNKAYTPKTSKGRLNLIAQLEQRVQSVTNECARLRVANEILEAELFLRRSTNSVQEPFVLERLSTARQNFTFPVDSDDLATTLSSDPENQRLSDPENAHLADPDVSQTSGAVKQKSNTFEDTLPTENGLDRCKFAKSPNNYNTRQQTSPCSNEFAQSKEIQASNELTTEIDKQDETLLFM